MKDAAGIVAIGIALVAHIPYIRDMLRGKCQPHLYTWITFFLVTITVAYTQYIGGGGIGAWPTIVGAVINGFILALCFKYGTRDVVMIDKVCLAISVVGVISFVVFHSHPLLSLIVVSIAEVTSFLPTLRKTYNAPYSESLPSYYLLMSKLTLILIALRSYNLLTVSYSVLWLVVIAVFLGLTTYRRRRKLLSSI